MEALKLVIFPKISSILADFTAKIGLVTALFLKFV